MDTTHEELPAEIVVRIVASFGGVVIAEAAGGGAHSVEEAPESRDLMDHPDVAMMGAEAALGALGYRLDRDTLYSEMGLMVGRFTRKN
jgi:hypothetical protein